MRYELDADFQPNIEALTRAVSLMCEGPTAAHPKALPNALPESGVTSDQALIWLAPHVFDSAAYLDTELSAAHMDPPTPWITWATTQWNARLNQSLLHAATAPVARALEQQVVSWLAPYFGMTGGHMTPGSTLANLTALWAARDCAGVTEVVASDMAHLSIAKAAKILGLELRHIPTNRMGAMLKDALPSDLSKSALVLTAGTTSTGATSGRINQFISSIGRRAEITTISWNCASQHIKQVVTCISHFREPSLINYKSLCCQVTSQ